MLAERLQLKRCVRSYYTRIVGNRDSYSINSHLSCNTLALVKNFILIPFFLTSRLLLVVVVVVVLRVVLVRDIELMVSWGESQSWNTCVVAMTIARGPLNVSQLELH